MHRYKGIDTNNCEHPDKKIEIHNPEIIDGQKKVKVDISLTAVGLISIPDSKELLHLMNEIRNEKSA